MQHIDSSTLQFLSELKENNNKPWFEANKPRHETARENVIAFIADVAIAVRKNEPILEKEPKKYVGRIYRDLRFSKDKTPYHSFMSGLIDRGADGQKCPLYINIAPGNTFVGGGIWQPEPELLKAVRQEIDYHSSEFNKIISNKTFKKYFSLMEGEKLARPPKGYEAQNPNIELLKLKQYVIHSPFDDKEVTSKKFGEAVMAVYHAALGFYQFLDVAKEEHKSLK
jgi:uncharacterized protein (TIGR02453 family)